MSGPISAAKSSWEAMPVVSASLSFACLRGFSYGQSTKAGNFDEKPPMNVKKYDKFIRLFCGAYEEMFKLTHCYLRAILPKHAKILVAGAGTGMEILEFGPCNPGWSFCGVDTSADMLALAGKKFSNILISSLTARFFGHPYPVISIYMIFPSYC